MERLTFGGNFCDIAQCAEIPGGSFCENGACSQRKVWERLKAYEDTGLKPEQLADAVSVVRCKDCAHSGVTEFGKRYCNKPLGVFAVAPVEDDGFCSYGKRRADNSEEIDK